MPDKKRTFGMEVQPLERRSTRPNRPLGKKSRPAAEMTISKPENEFSREMILRLIDWIKQV